MQKLRKFVRAWVTVPLIATFREQAWLLDMARGEANRMGRFGIEAKRGQTDARYREKGYLAFRFPSREMAQSFKLRIHRTREPRLYCTLNRHDSRIR